MSVLYSEFAIGIAAISTGLMAGIYFAFSVFIMESLKVLPDQIGIASMQSINKVILTSGFMPVFFGSSLLALNLMFVIENPLQTPWVNAAGLVYLVGMFICTLLFNVPLNKRLELIKDAKRDKQIWHNYLIKWTRWNHVRSISSFAASIGYVIALF